jgi:hypothetical protein
LNYINEIRVERNTIETLVNLAHDMKCLPIKHHAHLALELTSVAKQADKWHAYISKTAS